MRFPLTVSSFAGFLIIGIRLEGCCEFWESLDDSALSKILPFLAIGFFLMFFVELYSERKEINSAYPVFFAALSLWIYFLHLPREFNDISNGQNKQMLLLFSASFILALATLFSAKKYRESFWRNSRMLLARFTFTILMSVLLYELLSFTLQIMANFIYLYFNFLCLYLPDIGENHSQIAIVTALMVGMFFFLSEIPQNYQKGQKN